MKLYSYLEMRPNYIIKLPYPMSWMELSHWRFDPVTLVIVAATAATTAGVMAATAPKGAKPPLIPKVEPPPVEKKVSEAESEAVKRARRRKGIMETFITGELAPVTGEKTTLG